MEIIQITILVTIVVVGMELKFIKVRDKDTGAMVKASLMDELSAWLIRKDIL